MTNRAAGPFDVKITPLTIDNVADPGIVRMSLDKQYHGDLEGTSQGEMLSFPSPVQGSAGYVAMERVTGNLGGRRGTFALQHAATMDRGTPHLSITVVPDSGTQELTGLKGSMNIRIEADGKHFYEFEYDLPS